MARADDSRQEELSTKAWELVDEALRTGKLTVPDSGDVRELKTTDYLKMIEWLATLKQRKPKNLPPPRGVTLKPTDGES